MASPVDFEKIFGQAEPAKPSASPTGKPAEREAIDYGKIFGQKEAPESKSEEAYRAKVESLMPRAREEVKGGLTGGYATAFARGVGDIPFIGPAGEAATRAIMAGLGAGEGKNFSERYEQLRAEDEALRRAYSEGTGHKIAGAIGNIGGALALLPTGLGAASGTAAAARGAGTVGQTAAKIAGYGAEGAGYGAATAAGEKLFGTAPESEKMGIGQAALLGGGFGAGLGAAGMGISKAWRDYFPDWAKTFGRTDSKQWRELSEAFKEDTASGKLGMTPQEVAEARLRGQPVNLMDIGGPYVRAAAQKIEKANPEALAEYKAYMETRLAGARQRFDEFLAEPSIFGPPVNPSVLKEDARRLAKQLSDERYAKALQPGNGYGSWDKSWDIWLKNPAFRTAIARTEDEIKSIMSGRDKIDPVNFVSPFKEVYRINPKTGVREPQFVAGTRLPQLQIAFKSKVDIPYLDVLQRNLNDIAKRGFESTYGTRGGTGTAAADIRREILDALQKPEGKFYNPAYAETRAKYRQFMGPERDAYTFGEQLLSRANNTMESARLANASQYMSPKEREIAASMLMEDFRNRTSKMSFDAIQKNYFSKPYINQAMEAVLTPEKMANLKRFIATENLIKQSVQAVQGIRNSPERANQASSLMWAIMSGGHWSSFVPYLGNWATTNLSRGYSRKFIEKLKTNNVDDIMAAMNMIAKNKSWARNFAEHVIKTAPAIGGVAAGNLQNYQPPQFARGGAVSKSNQRNQDIHNATQGLLVHAMQGMADGGMVDKAAKSLQEMGGSPEQPEPTEGQPEQNNPLTNDVYHGTQGDFSEFKDDPQQHSLSRGLGIHVAKDPAVSSADYFTARGGDPRHGGRPGGNVMPMKTFPDEKFYPIYQPFEPDQGDYYHDDWAIRNEIMAHAYQNNPDLFVKNMMQQRKISKEEALDAHEKLSNGERWHDPSGGSAINFRGLVKNYALQPYSPEDREMAIRMFRDALREQGYEGVKYINTSTEETKNAKDKTAYIVFPDEKKEGEWFPLRSRFAKFDPAQSHKADITKEDGGPVGHYDDGGAVQEATAQDYNPSLRDRIGGFLAGESRPGSARYNLAKGLMGSAGVDSGGTGLVDFIPGVSVPFAAQDAKREMMAGNYGAAALNALGVIPAGRLVGNIGAKVSAPSVGEGIRAYHSSPSTFTKFSDKTIGSGTGMGYYGRGHYLSESPQISGRGGYYHDIFASRIDQNSPESVALKLLPIVNWDKTAAAAELRRYAGKMSDPDKLNLANQAADLLQSGKQIGPRTYETTIKAHPDQFIDFFKPLEQQSKYIQDVVAADPRLAKYFGGNGPVLGRTAEGDIQRLGRDLEQGFIQKAKRAFGLPASSGEELANKYLMKRGIEGKVYPSDELARSSTPILPKNYVVFDPNKINIEKSYKAGGVTRKKRATGGRIPEVDKMFRAAKRALDGETKQVLHTPDDIVVQALRIAKSTPTFKG